MTEILAHGYSSESTQRVLSKLNTNVAEYGSFSNILRPRPLDESSLGVVRVKSVFHHLFCVVSLAGNCSATHALSITRS